MMTHSNKLELHIRASNPGFYLVDTTMTITHGTGKLRNAQGVIGIQGIIRADDFEADAIQYMDGVITFP